jgi:hypothetical protein
MSFKVQYLLVFLLITASILLQILLEHHLKRIEISLKRIRVALLLLRPVHIVGASILLQVLNNIGMSALDSEMIRVLNIKFQRPIFTRDNCINVMGGAIICLVYYLTKTTTNSIIKYIFLSII